MKLLRREPAFVPPPGSYELAVGEQRFVAKPQRIWLTPAMAATHALIVGQTGSGKSKLIESLLRQYLEAGQGFCLLDLHGDLALDLCRFIASRPPDERERITERLVWVDMADPDMTVSFNPLAASSETEAATQLLELVAAFRRHWSDSWGPRLSDVLTHSLAVLQAHRLALTEVALLLGDKGVRADLLSDPRVGQTARDFFSLRYDPLPKRDQVLMSESTLNKTSALLSDYRVRTFLGAAGGTLNPRQAISEGQIVLCRLPRGVLVENAELVASLILASFHTAALSRVSVEPARRRPYALILDEGQVASETFPQLLAGARAFGLSVVCGVQFLDQLPPLLAEALLANCRVRACFRVSRRDAERLARELFRIDGDHVKHVDQDLLGSRKSRPVYWSPTEEFEYACRELQDQDVGECVLQLGRGVPWFAETVPVAAAYPEPAASQELAVHLRRHSRLRSDVAREIERRRERLTHQPITTKGGANGDPHHDPTLEPVAAVPPGAR